MLGEQFIARLVSFKTSFLLQARLHQCYLEKLNEEKKNKHRYMYNTFEFCLKPN